MCQCFGGSVFGVVTVCAGVIVVVFWQGWYFCERNSCRQVLETGVVEKHRRRVMYSEVS